MATSWGLSKQFLALRNKIVFELFFGARARGGVKQPITAMFFVDIFGFPSRDVFHFVASLCVCNFCAFSIAYQSKLCKGTSLCFKHCGFVGNIAFGGPRRVWLPGMETAVRGICVHQAC